MFEKLFRWWDTSVLNKPLFFRPKILFHGTTLSYYAGRATKNKDYFYHDQIGLSGSAGQEVFFEKNPKQAVSWACTFAKKYKDEPVLLVISTKNLPDLRRVVGYFYPYYRVERVPMKDVVMIRLEFKEDLWKKGVWRNPWSDLTEKCIKQILAAQARLLGQYGK